MLHGAHSKRRQQHRAGGREVRVDIDQAIDPGYRPSVLSMAGVAISRSKLRAFVRDPAAAAAPLLLAGEEGLRRFVERERERIPHNKPIQGTRTRATAAAMACPTR